MLSVPGAIPAYQTRCDLLLLWDVSLLLHSGAARCISGVSPIGKYMPVQTLKLPGNWCLLFGNACTVMVAVTVLLSRLVNSYMYNQL